MRNLFFLKLLLSLFFLGTTVSSAFTSERAELKKTLSYDQALANLSTRGGEPSFDLHFAGLALAAGHAEHAVFALERYLMHRPKDWAVHLLYVRALLASNDLASAGRRIKKLPSMGLPSTYTSELLALEKEQRAQLRRPTPFFRGGFQYRLGTDTNINSMTTDYVASIPDVGDYILPPELRRAKDHLHTLKLWANHQHVLWGGLAWQTQLLFSVKEFFNEHRFDSSMLSIKTGPSFEWQGFKFYLPIQYMTLWLDRVHFTTAWATAFRVSRPFFESHQVTLDWVQKDQKNHPNSDYDRALFQLALRDTYQKKGSRFRWTWGPLLVGGGNKEPEYGYGLKRGFGIMGVLDYVLSDAVRVNFNGKFARYSYQDPLPYYKTRRRDQSIQLGLGWYWAFKKDMELSVDYRYDQTQSSIRLFQQNRNRLGISLAHTWGA